MKLAIVGSVSLADNPQALRVIEDVLDRYHPDTVVSGGAIGIDTMAETAARRRGIEPLIFRPEVFRWDGGTRIGFKQRNQQIAEACDVLVRIVVADSKTYGSGYTRDYARKMGKPTEEFVIEGNGHA